MDKKWAADDDQQRASQLEEVTQRMAAADKMLRASMAPLLAKIEQVATAAETVAG